MEENTREQFRTPATSYVSGSVEETNQVVKCNVPSFNSNRSDVTRSESVSVIQEPLKNSQPVIKGKFRLPEHILFNKGQPVPYKCTVCGKTFKSKSNCCYHKHCANGSEKPFSCSVCNHTFSTKNHFKYHSLMHSGLNPFKCTRCSKSFKTRHKLARHEEVHSDESKSFSCDICGRTFLREASVKVHKRCHTEGKSFNCSECPKAFREKKNLIFHLNSHKGAKDWICEVCGKSYAIKWNLELHKRTHTRVRPFQCPVAKCQQSFSQNRYLKRHLETHKNSIKYVCSICEKVFSRKDNLQRHAVNTHLEYQTQNIPKNEKASKLRNHVATRVNSNPKSAEKANEHSNAVLQNPSVSAVRTESVIKSVSRTQNIVDFCTKPEESSSNCVSVIKRIDEINSCDSDGLSESYRNDDAHARSSGDMAVSHYIDEQSAEFENGVCSPERRGHCQNDFDEPLEQSRFDVDVRPTSPQYLYLNNATTDRDLFLRSENVDYLYSGTVHCELRSNVISHTSDIHVGEDLFEDISTQQYSNVLPAKSRCLLPKKVITASYKECSFTACEDLSAEGDMRELYFHSGNVERRYHENYNLLDLSLKSQE